MPAQRSTRLERSRVDHPRPAGDRREPPAHSISKSGAEIAQAERRLRPGLEALDAGRVAQQPETDVAGPGRSRGRPRRRPGGATARGRGGVEGRVVERRPDPSRRGLHEDAPLDRRRSACRFAATRHSAAACPTAISDPDRVPDRLHLEEGGDPLGALGGAVVEPVEAALGDARRAGAARRLTSSAASSSTSVRRSSGTPQSRARRRRRGRRGPARAPPCSPVRTLTTPPGTSDVASTSVSVTAGSGRVSRGEERRPCCR